MFKPAITSPLKKSQLKALTQFLSYHMGYVPCKEPKALFCKTAKHYAEMYEGYKLKGNPEELIEEINKSPAFFDHLSDTLVFQAFSYHEGIEIPKFLIPMTTVLHELLHFFQYATGTYGTHRIMYEGTNDLLVAFFTNELTGIDYKFEARIAFNLAMEIKNHNFWEALQWMKAYNVHSEKNKFVHRSVKQCAAFSKYNPKKLLNTLDLIADTNKVKSFDMIENEETRNILTKYSYSRMLAICKQHYQILEGSTI